MYPYLKLDASFPEAAEGEEYQEEEEDHFDHFATQGKPSWSYPKTQAFAHAYLLHLSKLHNQIDGLD